MTRQGKKRSLRLRYHGRILDHLGIEMYQSPVAAIAEMVANAWDADAKNVKIQLPENLEPGTTLTVEDDGLGMTFRQCQDRYLNVGWCRRESDPDEKSSENNRPILGRKGIGKFAGFGIAEVIEIETTSGETGERTRFLLDVNELRGNEYVEKGKKIEVIEYLKPNKKRKKQRGTKITLKSLKLSRNFSVEQFSRSMARRFLLLQWAHEFEVLVNSKPIPQEEDLASVQYVFPQDYPPNDRPSELVEADGWGKEVLSTGKEVRWKFYFFKEPIGDEEFTGISVFAKVKLAQKPFFFNLSGGLGGQHGQEYLAGQVRADFIDLLERDLISPERQRINWEHPEAMPLEVWGQKRIKELLRIWRELRGESRRKEIEAKLSTFSERLETLSPHERKTVKSALTKIGGIPTLSDEQFRGLSEAMLSAWEQGRLKELIDAISRQEDLKSEDLLGLLAEAEVLVALNIAEVVKTKLEAVRSLRKLVERGVLENKIRDYIAEKPYLLKPKWETFKRETSVKHILDEAASEAGLEAASAEGNEFERKRIDLALRSGEELLVVELMRPGKPVDYDHLTRCKAYIHLVRNKVRVQTALGIKTVSGLLIADELEKKPQVQLEISDMATHGILAYEWESLLADCESGFEEFLQVVGDRAPRDNRLKSLQAE